MLLAEHDAGQPVVAVQSLEQGDVQCVGGGKVRRTGGRTQLLVVACGWCVYVWVVYIMADLL